MNTKFRIYSIVTVVLLFGLMSGCKVGGKGSSCMGLIPADPSKSASAASYELSGNFTVDGKALAGVTVTLSGTDLTATTDADGNYTFTDLANGTYTVVPSLTGYVFTPISEVVTIDGSSAATDFTSTAPAPADPVTPTDPTNPATPTDPVTPVTPTTYKISGMVGSHETLGYIQGSISGVTVTLSGANTGTTTTDADGYYEFSGLANGTYYVTPSKPEYSFIYVDNHGSENYSLVNVEGSDQGNIDFVGAAITVPSLTVIGKACFSETYPGSGRQGLAGVTVTMTGSDGVHTATTDSTGIFRFSGTTSGNYTITASLAGYTFTPGTLNVTVVATAGTKTVTGDTVFTVTAN